MKLFENHLNIIAKFISYFFNPAIMPTIGILFILNAYGSLVYIPIDVKWSILTIVFIGTFILPLISYFIMYKLKIISNLEMNLAKERIIPYLITLIFYVTTYLILQKIPITFIKTFLLSIVVILAINIVILFYWKISSHAIGIGGIIGLLIALIFCFQSSTYIGLLLLSILVAGLIGFARLQLNAHNPRQVYSGFIMGCLLTSIFIFFN